MLNIDSPSPRINKLSPISTLSTQVSKYFLSQIPKAYLPPQVSQYRLINLSTPIKQLDKKLVILITIKSLSKPIFEPIPYPFAPRCDLPPTDPNLEDFLSNIVRNQKITKCFNPFPSPVHAMRILIPTLRKSKNS